MIYTVTFNPSIDYIMDVSDICFGRVNRSSGEDITVGGKGINVSIVLKNLGVQSECLGYVAGYTGDLICSMLKDSGVGSDFVRLDEGFSRINVKLKSHNETDINGCGPSVKDCHIKALVDKLGKVNKDDFLVLSGSVSGNTNADAYANIMESVSDCGVKVVVDATGDLLVNCLKHKPFLIKPNNYELEEIFGVQFINEQQISQYAFRLCEMGAQNVLVSLGAKGAMLVCSNGDFFKESAPDGKVLNTTGSGDSMVAGFIAQYIESHNLKEALRMGICAGSATAFSNGLASADDIMKLMKS